jgi:glycerophosphoryl diester phosphodiesterase
MIIIGHRGARGLAPENTLASFQKAIENKVAMIEFDVRVTKDKVPVLHHDSAIRINGTDALISSKSLHDLQQIKPDLATLSDGLHAIDAQAKVYVEVKPHEDIQPIVTVLKGFIGGTYVPEDVFLASKDQDTLVALHKALPQQPTIVIEAWSGVRGTRRARQLDTKHIAMNQLWLWSGFIHAYKRSGYCLYAYTLNSEAKAKRWKRAGLAGVITDYPDRFKK